MLWSGSTAALATRNRATIQSPLFDKNKNFRITFFPKTVNINHLNILVPIKTRATAGLTQVFKLAMHHQPAMVQRRTLDFTKSHPSWRLIVRNCELVTHWKTEDVWEFPQFLHCANHLVMAGSSNGLLWSHWFKFLVCCGNTSHVIKSVTPKNYWNVKKVKRKGYCLTLLRPIIKILAVGFDISLTDSSVLLMKYLMKSCICQSVSINRVRCNLF